MPGWPPWLEQLFMQMPFVVLLGYALIKLQAQLSDTQEKRVADAERVLARMLEVVDQLGTHTQAIRELTAALRQQPKKYVSVEDLRGER